jgi:hypothetical protein
MKLLYYLLMLASVVLLFVNRNKLDRRFRWFYIVLILGIGTQLLVELLSGPANKKVWPMHVYVPLEYFFLSLYYSQIHTSRVRRTILWVSNILFIGFCFFYYSGNRLNQMDFSGFVIEMTMVSFWVILFFADLFKEEGTRSLRYYPDFWVNTGNLFFYTGCIFSMGLYFVLLKQNYDHARDVLQINHYLNLLLYCFYAIAFLCPSMKNT